MKFKVKAYLFLLKLLVKLCGIFLPKSLQFLQWNSTDFLPFESIFQRSLKDSSLKRSEKL